MISLENFDEYSTEPPYLNSLRSLEACKRHGIEPQDLLYVPLSDYKKRLEERNLGKKSIKSLWEHHRAKRDHDFKLVSEVIPPPPIGAAEDN